MKRRAFIGASSGLLMAQTDKVPGRRFKYGEVLRGDKYTATLQDFGIVVRSEDAYADHVEIQVGYETELQLSGPSSSPTKLLRFQTFTSSCFVGVDMAVGVLPNIELIRTIRVVMLKKIREDMFR